MKKTKLWAIVSKFDYQICQMFPHMPERAGLAVYAKKKEALELCEDGEFVAELCFTLRFPKKYTHGGFRLAPSKKPKKP